MILGIVIFIIIGFILYIIGTSTKEPERILELPSDIQPIRLYAGDCLKGSVISSLTALGKSGMYRDLPLESDVVFSVEFDPFSENYTKSAYYVKLIPKYLENNNLLMPSIDVIEAQLTSEINEQFNVCIDNFDVFSDAGFSFDLNNLNVNAKISQNIISSSVNSTIKIYKGGSITEINDLAYLLDYNFLQKYGLVKAFLDEQSKDLNYMPVGFLTNLAYTNNFTYETHYLGEDSIQYSFIFNDYEAHSREPFVYSFIIQYRWNASNKSNVSIEPMPEFNITEEEIFEYKVNATGDDLTFYDYTDLFDIENKTGLISFDARFAPNGKKNILIKAIDKYGNEDFSYIRININKPVNLPVIEDIEGQTAYIGSEFFYKVKAKDPSNTFLMFLDDTSLFDINTLTGEIKVIPDSKGNYSIKITAVNDIGHAFKFMGLEVKWGK